MDPAAVGLRTRPVRPLLDTQALRCAGLGHRHVDIRTTLQAAGREPVVVRWVAGARRAVYLAEHCVRLP